MAPQKKQITISELSSRLKQENNLNKFIFWCHYQALEDQAAGRAIRGFRPSLSVTSVQHIRQSQIILNILACQGSGTEDSAHNVFKSRSRRMKLFAQGFILNGVPPPEMRFQSSAAHRGVAPKFPIHA